MIEKFFRRNTDFVDIGKRQPIAPILPILASGKHNCDKRAALHEKSAKCDVERALKERLK